MKKEKLEEFNEWWYSGRVPADLLESYQRKPFSALAKDLNKRQIISITGLRRVGKTTLMYQLIGHILKKETKPVNVLFFSFDESVKELDDVLGTYREVQKRDFRSDKTYIFLDEIQKLENWQDQVKKYYDLYPKIKFIISGSESLFIGRKAKETLAGRIFEHHVPPLSFKEFLELRGIRIAATPGAKLKSLFREFVLKGGLPEMAEEPDMDAVKRYTREGVVDKVIYKDILKISGIRDVDLLLTILEILATSPGMYLEYQSLAQQLDRDRRVVKGYVMLLRDGFMVKLMKNFRGSRAATLRKRKRVYMCDNSLIAAFKPSIDDTFFGKMVENAVVNSLSTDMFWKNSHEVDAVVEGNPVEVKYKEKVIARDYRGIREFMRVFRKREGVIVTKNEEKEVKVEEGIINLIPAHKFLAR